MMKTPILVIALVAVHVAFHDVTAQDASATTTDVDAAAATVARDRAAVTGSITNQSEAQERLLAAEKCGTKVDPRDIHPCRQKPYWLQGDPNIYGLTPVGGFCPWWWWYAIRDTIQAAKKGDRSAKEELAKMPKDFKHEDDYDEDGLKRLGRDSQDIHPESPFPDLRAYYWHPQCNHKIQYLHCFRHRKYGRCYIMWPQRRFTPYAKCIDRHCDDRCRLYQWRIKNTRCYESCYQWFYRKVYCPNMYRHDPLRCNWCKYYKWRCMPWIWIKLPQCCECQQCWYMGVTRALKDAKLTLSQKVAMLADSDAPSAAAKSTEQFIPHNEEEAVVAVPPTGT